MDVVDTGADVAGVGLVDEDLEKLGIRLGVLNGENISIESSDGVEEVLELRVAEVRVDLGRVLNTGGGETESLNGPLKVVSALLARAERETLTESRLIDLDNINASLLKVDDLVTESQSELLSLDGLVDIVTRERPSQASDRASQHTLHGLGRDGHSVLGLLDGHGSGTRDVTDNDGRTNATRTIRLDPSVCSEGITIETLTKELNHVVTLRLTVDENVKAKLLLDLDVVIDLLLDELVVLSLSDLTLGELVTLNTNLGSLGERTNGGGGEERKLELSLLLRKTSRELALSVVVSLSDLGLAVLDLRVVGAARGGTGVHGLGVSLELLLDGGRAVSNSLGNDGNLNNLLAGKGEPVSDLGIELLLAGKSVRSVEEGAGGGNNDTLLAELLDSSLNSLDGLLQVGLPDVTAVNNTSGEDGLGAKSTNDGVELLGVTDKVNVDGIDILGESIDVVDNVSEVGGENKLGDLVTESSKLLVDRAELALGLGREVEDEDGLVNLDSLGTGGLELSEQLLVDGHQLVDQVDGVNGGTTVSLTEVEERYRTNEDGAGGNASLLGLEELSNSLGLSRELEGLVILESGLDIVVVGVEPLDHLQ